MVRQFILIILLGFVASVNAQTDRTFIREGNRMYRNQDYVNAEILYRKAVAKNPSNSQAVYNLGCALMMQNKDSAAIIQYQNAAKLETNKLRLAGIYHNVGVVCQKHKMYGDAIKAYEQSLRNNSKDDETRYNLALCKRMQKSQNKNNDKDKQNKEKKENEKSGDKNKSDNNEDKKQSAPKEQISKDNAEQLLNAAIQDEKSTQQRLKKALQKLSGKRQLQKNW